MLTDTADTCPKCGIARASGPECPACGVIYEKAEALRERSESRLEEEAHDARLQREAAAATSVAPAYSEHTRSVEEAKLELVLRAVAIPVALLGAYLAMHSGGIRFLGTTFMGMWVHELGHAAMAWLCGHFAFPGPWVAWIGQSRNVLVILLVTAGLLVLGAYGLREGKKHFVALAASLLLVQIISTLLISRDTAQMLITFFGDGGALLLGTAFMLTVYSQPGSKLHQGWLRWGFLIIGAVAFADVLHTWLPARTDFGAIPFGVQDYSGLSDASKLVEHFGWDERALVLRHLRLAMACGLLLAAVYVVGLVKSRDEVRRASK